MATAGTNYTEQPSQPTTPKPGENWVAVNGNWVPPDHPMAQQSTSYAPPAPAPTAAPAPAAAPAAPAPAPTAAPAPTTPDPFTAMGGGVFVNGGWVPKNHPLAAQAGAQAAAAPGAVAPGAATTQPGGNLDNALNAKILELISQGKNVGLDDPNIRPQMDALKLQEERQMQRSREALAERLGAQGMTDSGALNAGVIGLEENRGARIAGFGAGLIGDELKARRNEIMAALQLGAGRIDAASERALREQLAELDAAVRREGIASQDRLGQGDLNARLMDIMLRDQQFNKRLGLDYDLGEADINLRSVQPFI